MTQFLSSRNKGRYFVRGVVEIVDAMRFWRLWSLMGISALRSRYSRSRVGEFWLTLSMGIMVFALGLIWSLIWRLPLADIVPYIAVSLVVWTFMTGTITDATRSLIMASSYLINQRMYATIPVYSVIYSNLLSLAHNAVIVVIVMVLFQRPVGWSTLLFVPGLLLTVIVFTFASLIIAIICARFRDVIQLIAIVLQTSMFLTPVLFKPDFIPQDYYWINFVNPFAVYLAIVRDPLLGLDLPVENWFIATGIALVLAIVTCVFVGRYSRRVAFWI
jgi:ABC-type polysaccharide/polyol phosphate export permease